MTRGRGSESGPFAGVRQAASADFFAKRRRAISPAAAAPNRIIIGGAGTGDGLPLLLPP